MKIFRTSRFAHACACGAALLSVCLSTLAAPGPGVAQISIETLTNGVDADDPNTGDAPVIAPNDVVHWDYVFTNTGSVTLSSVSVTDDQFGVVCWLTSLAPAQQITCSATGTAEDLAATSATTVTGVCEGIAGATLYENTAVVAATTPDSQPIGASDPSHYCNPMADADQDAVPDAQDNCRLRANPAQRDTDGDGIGNFCDPDFDQNCTVDFLDLGFLKSVFFTTDHGADLNGSGLVEFIDLGIVKSLFFMPPGPSGLQNICS